MMFICNSKVIGLLYFISSLLGGVIGFSFSIYIRLELSVPFSMFIDDFYFICVTSHGVIMLFFFLTIISSGFSNLLIPDLCFVNDMFLKSVNLFGLYLVWFSFLFLVLSLLIGDGVGTGWTLYTPLSLLSYNSTQSVEMVIFSMHLFSLSSLVSSMNILLTVLFIFYMVESFFDFSIFVLSFCLVGFLIMFSIPVLTGVLTMLLFDSVCNTFFFSFEFGGDSLLFQMLFWLFGHPEVYILMFPVFGIISLIMEILFGGLYNSMGIVFSMMMLFMLSFVVFGHHMVAVGYGMDFSGFFMMVTVIMSLPTSVKVFSWLNSLFVLNVSFNFMIGLLVLFLFFFVIGGSSGILLSNVILDLIFHDTYFVIAHFHTVLSIVSISGFLSGFCYFFSSFMFFYLSFSFVCYFFISFILFSILFLLFFHMIGMFGFPSSVISYYFVFYFYCYYGSLSLVGLFFLMFYFMFLLLVSFLL